MAKQLRVMYWRCNRCGQMNRMRATVLEFEPTIHTCDHCSEETTVQPRDLVESPTRLRMPRRRSMDEEG